LESLVPYVRLLSPFAVLIGGAGMVLVVRRTGKRPGARVLLPWAALHVWYAAYAEHDAALAWFQIFHAIQYLGFPARVELNRQARKVPPPRPAVVLVLWYALAVAGGWFVFRGLGWGLGTSLQRLG